MMTPVAPDPMTLKAVQQMAQEVADSACAPLLEQEHDYHDALKRLEFLALRLRRETRKEVILKGASELRDLLQVIEGYADEGH